MLYHQDTRFCAGDNKTLNVSITNPSGAGVSGLAAYYIIATAPMGKRLVSKASPTDITIAPGTDPIAIVLTIGLRNDDTADLEPGDYYHEAMLKLSNGSLVTVMSGNIRLDPSNIASLGTP